MKIIRLIIAPLLVTLALAACNKEDDMPDGNTLPEGAVHITAGIEGVQTRTPQLDADGAGTFAPTDEWGMYTFTGDAASPAYSNQNLVYKADNSTPLYWENLSETEAVTFSAHYPRITENIANPTAYLYAPWSHTDDLLHATATASKGGTVALTFKHLMHRLVVNLTAGEGMTGTDLSSALINSTAKDGSPTMLTSAEVNLLTGAVNYGSSTDGISLSNGGSGNADWIVAPQDLTAGAGWLKITVGEDGNENVWYYHVPATLNSSNTQHPTRLESGKRLTLNLTLKKSPDTGNTEVELTGSDISGWDTQSPITDEVVIGGITTYDALIAAVADATGTEEAPARITLTADITLPWVDGAEGVDASVIVSDGKYIEIDGGGHSLFPHKYGNAFWIRGGASLKLSNITIDGQDADRDTPVITMFGNTTNKLTLGKDFKLTRAKMRTSTLSEYQPYGIDGAQGTLVIEDGAEISGCGNGVAIRVNSNCSLRLKGGKVSGNSGYSIRLAGGIRPVDARIENTLPVNARFENIFLDSYSERGDVRAGFETVFAAAPGCTLTADDFAKFTLKEVDMSTDAFELYLDANAIKLRKKN